MSASTNGSEKVLPSVCIKIKNINCGLYLWCDESLGSVNGRRARSIRRLVEVNLLRYIRLVINCLHVLWMDAGVCVVEHLLHCWQHRLIDVRRCRHHHLVVCWRANDDVTAILLTHHSIRLFDDHASVFDRFVVGSMRWETIVAGVGGATRWRNRAGVNVGIDDRLILLLMVRLVITWKHFRIVWETGESVFYSYFGCNNNYTWLGHISLRVILWACLEMLTNRNYRLSWDFDSYSLLSENREQLRRDRLRWYHSGDSQLQAKVRVRNLN